MGKILKMLLYMKKIYFLTFFILVVPYLSAFSVQILNMENQSFQGELIKITEKKEPEIILRDSKTKKKLTLPCQEIVQVVCQKSVKIIKTSMFVILNNGNKIYGEITNGNEAELEITSPSLGILKYDFSKVREIHFKNNLPSLNQVDTTKDILFFTGGDMMKGAIENIGKGFVEFQHPRLGLRREYFDKLDRIIFAEFEKFSPSSNTSLLATVIALDQSEISGRITRVQEESLQLETDDKNYISIPLQNIQHFFFQGGKFVYISDLPKSQYKVEYTHYFPNYANTYSAKLNKNYDGDMMVIEGQSFFKGIGVLPRTKIIITLNKEFQKFQSHIGIDDRVIKELQSGQDILEGSAVFQVWLDGEKKYDSGICQTSEIQQLDIPIKNGKQLILLVDYGKFPVGRNLANWAGARLIK